MLGRLTDVTQLRAPQGVIRDTWSALRQFGRSGAEGFVLWLGHVDGAMAVVDAAFVPPQESIRSEDGVGYFVTTETLFRLNVHLVETKLRLLAQVHSHPTEAYHSATDDKYAVVTTQGGFSIVVPDFARRRADANRCAIYRLRDGRWLALNVREIAATCRWDEE